LDLIICSAKPDVNLEFEKICMGKERIASGKIKRKRAMVP